MADHPALHAAVGRGAPLVLLFLLDEVSDEIRPLGGASRWWLHGSLASLGERVAALGGQLVLRRGAAEQVIPDVVEETRAGAVFWNRRYGASRDIDARLKTRLRADGLEVRSFSANLLVEPWTVTTEQGNPYQVLTPFWRAAQQRPMREPLPTPDRLAGPAVEGDTLDDWMLLPSDPDWAAGLRAAWTPGEADAARRLEDFATGILINYHRRDEPAQPVTSLLSPSLRFGEVSPTQVWHRLHGSLAPPARRNTAKFLSELGWREFNHSVLFHQPDLATRNHRATFDAFPWNSPDPSELRAWQRGRTGIPLVDAGMRELWTTGYMHNRVRMVTASFLVKNLLVDWRVGEQWFWDTLVDADPANNPFGWQWVAGSGFDAQPYFRIFNPVLQGEKFDADGANVRQFVPELAGLPDR
ncbi:MAG: deoxyribodipyrimidine photo-lyase, partial [Pseudolysinimonas sp.]